MRVFPVTWQIWRSHHSIRHSRNETPCFMHANFTLSSTAELLPIEFLHCGNREFRTVLLLWPWPWPDHLHVRAWPVSPQDVSADQNELSICQAFRKLSYYRQTDTLHTDRRHHKNITSPFRVSRSVRISSSTSYHFHHNRQSSISISRHLSVG